MKYKWNVIHFIHKEVWVGKNAKNMYTNAPRKKFQIFSIFYFKILLKKERYTRIAFFQNDKLERLHFLYCSVQKKSKILVFTHRNKNFKFL